MKNFTERDLFHDHILFASSDDLRLDELHWQKRGLQQTSTGHGSKLTTPYKIVYDNRAYRIYATCHGNAPSTWFIVRGKKIYVH